MLLKKNVYHELFKNVNVIYSNKQNLENKIEDVNKHLPCTYKFIETHEFTRLTKINFNARMTKHITSSIMSHKFI